MMKSNFLRHRGSKVIKIDWQWTLALMSLKKSSVKMAIKRLNGKHPFNWDKLEFQIPVALNGGHHKIELKFVNILDRIF